MIYFIYGNTNVLIDEKLNEIISNNDHYHYYGNDSSFNVSNLISELNKSSLFSDKTVYILHNYVGLSKKIKDDEYDLFENYLNNPSSINDLVFISYEIDKKLKFYKMLIKKAEIHEYYIDNKNFNNYSGQAFSKFNLKLDYSLKKLLINNCNCDYSLLYNNLLNLSNYDGEINEETIKQITSVNHDIDVFNLINSILMKQKTDSLRYYRELIHNYDVRQLIAILVGQIHYMYQVLYYDHLKYNVDKICEYTNTSNPYRVTMTLNKARNFSLKEVISLLNSLYEFNYNTRFNSNIDENDFFEIWLLNL